MVTVVVDPYYVMGIKEGRESFERYGIAIAQAELRNLAETIKGFAASSPVGAMLRGERDFWRNQVAISERPHLYVQQIGRGRRST